MDQRTLHVETLLVKTVPIENTLRFTVSQEDDVVSDFQARWPRVARFAAQVRNFGLTEIPVARLLKRMVDVIVATAALIVVAPLAAAIALLVRLDSSGPIFYKQTRVARVLGRNTDGTLRIKTFLMWKFRTMRPDAERTTGVVLARAGDTRITRIGTFLRKTRLDELPQFVHVLLGDMSVVGPRPERPELLTTLAAEIPCFEERVAQLKPGITGLAQISLRYNGDAPANSRIGLDIDPPLQPTSALIRGMRLKLAFDMAYAASVATPWSMLKTDVRILVRTPLVMLRGLGQ